MNIGRSSINFQKKPFKVFMMKDLWYDIKTRINLNAMKIKEFRCGKCEDNFRKMFLVFYQLFY